MESWDASLLNYPPPLLPKSAKASTTLNPLTSRQRNVAQQRRKMETEEFQKLGAVLPISRAISEQHIDKTTIVRLAASYIRLHHLLGFRGEGRSSMQFNFGFGNEFTPPSIIDIIDGFLVVLSENGDILYVSETISLHLGLSQVEMIGNPFYNYFHPSDSENFQEFLKTSLYAKESNTNTFRVKSTLTKRSSKDFNNPNAGYRPLQITLTTYHGGLSSQTSNYVTAYCQPHLIGPGVTIRLSNESFIITTDMAFKIVYIDPYVSTFFDRKTCALVSSHSELKGNWKKGVSFYSLIFPEDAYLAQEMHQNLFKFHSYKSPLIQLIADDNCNVLTVEIFAISYSSANAHGNSQKATGEHFVLICTYIG